MERNEEVLYTLKPKFNLLYELTMPTGKKIRSALFTIIVAILVKVVLTLTKGYILSIDSEYATLSYRTINIVLWLFVIFSVVLFVVKLLLQIFEYRGMTYTFYNNCMIYENNFLSQTRKTIEYSNVKEVEIRRNILDRIMNYGIIIIYTNADRMYGSATVLYAIKDTQKHYDKIESIIHGGNQQINNSNISNQNNINNINNNNNNQ